ncbi:hypothetical protein [Sideroxydans sp. CL21]|uniref:AbiU2 domain-containing protein n=1 Tax=Sideroxydans sp. CL21 TaxID=2600596 RepID=UPI0024BC11A5|nr:hypothetical protein [Sideroxydans sp. CL21]
MSIPVELSDIWEFLNSQVVWLHGRWIVYRQIYGTNPKRIDLINEAAPTFFWMIEQSLMNDVQLTLVKLADPSTTCGRENLTLETLVTEVERISTGELSTTMRQSLVNFRQCCEKIRQRRHKDIAHFDLSVQLGNKAEVLPSPSRQEIELALLELRKFMNLFLDFFQNTQMAYEHFSLSTDGNTLLFRLKESLRYEQLQSLGTIPHEDIVQSTYHLD